MSKESAWFDRMDPIGPAEEEEEPIQELDISPRISPWLEDMYNPLALPSKPDDPAIRPDSGQPRSPRDIMNSVIMSSKGHDYGKEWKEVYRQTGRPFRKEEHQDQEEGKEPQQGDVDFALIFKQKQAASSSWRTISHVIRDDEEEQELLFPNVEAAIQTNKDVLGEMPGTGNHAIGHGGIGLIESALNRPQMLAAYSDDVDIFDIAASLANAMVENHPFENGNHRTAYHLTHDFLEDNGYEHLTEEDDHEFARKILGLTQHGRGKMDDPFRDPDDIQPEPATADDVAKMFRDRHEAHMTTAHRLSKVAGDVERKTCRFCKRAAVRILVWAGGNAMLPVCGKHIGMGNRMIHDQHEEVVDRIDLTPDSGGNYHDFKESDPKHEHHNVTAQKAPPNIKPCDKAFHKDVFMPLEAIQRVGSLPLGPVVVNFGNHAIEEWRKDRYKKTGYEEDPPSFVNLKPENIVEVHLHKADNSLEKVLGRFPYDEENDIVIPLVNFVKRESGGYMATGKTIWMNRNDDIHNTLDPTPYVQPPKQ